MASPSAERTFKDGGGETTRYQSETRPNRPRPNRTTLTECPETTTKPHITGNLCGSAQAILSGSDRSICAVMCGWVTATRRYYERVI